MKNFAFIVAVLMFTSCGSLRKKEVVRHDVYRDSVTITHEVFLDTFKVPMDSFSNQVPIDYLKQLGEITFRGDRTTTKLFYKDGNVGFNTTSDSLIHVLLNKVSTLEKLSTSENTSTSTDYKSGNRKAQLFLWGIGLVIVALLLIYLIILKFKR